MARDLFDAAAQEALRVRAPLAERLRPADPADVVGQPAALSPSAPLGSMLAGGHLRSILLWGPPGSGKTTLARLLARRADAAFEPLSATSASVSDVRAVVARAEERLGAHGRGTVLFLDEVHRFSKSQQDALLPAVESGLVVLVGATSEHAGAAVIPPLRSRMILVRLGALDDAALTELAARGATAEGIVLGDDARAALVHAAGGDARRLLTLLEAAAAAASAEGRSSMEVDDVSAAVGHRLPRHGAAERSDVLSAFIKSIRGSDGDGAMYWMGRLLAGGEDPLVVARRLVVAASEDIGPADPQSLVLATAAADAVRTVGLPEAAYALAQATLHLAAAPKSRLVADALDRATEAVAADPFAEVPPHLRFRPTVANGAPEPGADAGGRGR